MFQGSKTKVTVQLKEKHVPFLLGVHYVARWTNLVVQTLFWLSLVAKIKAFLQVVHIYYAQSPKWTLEITKLAEFLKKKHWKSWAMWKCVGFQCCFMLNASW
jgi:hypothetical protein